MASVAFAVAVPTSIPDDLRGVLGALARQKTAAVRLDRVSGALGVAEAEAAVTVAALQALDLVDVWETGPGGRACVVLTTLAAELLDVELSDRQRGGFRAYWSPRGRGVDPGPMPDDVLLECDASDDALGPTGFLDSIADPAAIDPAEAAEAADQLEASTTRPEAMRRNRRAGIVPSPRILLGLGFAWRADMKAGADCPGCAGRSLRTLEVCLVPACNRSGVDRMLEPVPAVDRPKRRKPKAATAKARASAVGLGGGTGPAGEPKEVKSPGPKRKATKKKRAEVKAARNSFDLSRL